MALNEGETIRLIVNDSCLRGHHSFLKIEGERALLSQPIILALNISRENNVSFRLKEQRIWKAERIAPKETWLTYEPNSSRADRQQSPDGKRRAVDMAPAI